MEGRRRAGFRRARRERQSSANPRDLFRDLSRDPAVTFLWGHQERILEAYEEIADDAGDIALELPTGTGKTLIGLLIAEWRRRSLGHRVLYLCPTRQLVNQVSAQAEDYGIPAAACLAPEYDGIDRWQSGETVAISTYAALFNYNPRFTAPQTLILDDAHAADGYVAGHWTVTVDREQMAGAYAELANLLAPCLDRRTALLTGEDQISAVDASAVELVPLPRWWPHRAAVEAILDRAVEGTDEWYAWHQHLRGKLSACSLLISSRQMVLRPWIPTTRQQSQFAAASQRVYMSATPGAGGELERIFGVDRIERLPVPSEWERRSTGRRLFLLPAISLGAAEREKVLNAAVERAGRVLVLSPNTWRAEERARSLREAGTPVLDAGDIEDDLSAFLEQERAALVLANRYDGIDLPGEDCRLLVIDGLPVAVNALEEFLYQRLGATSILGERVRTRFTQGVGRCTRGEGDWCAVVVVSQEAYDFFSRGEVRSLLHPELQAELGFGLEESRGREADEFAELLEIFLEHGDDWKEAEGKIHDRREDAHQGTAPAAAQLADVVRHEVAFVYAMASGDYPGALQAASAVADGLDGPSSDSYRAWWLYLAGSAAWLTHHEYGAPGMLERARARFADAVSTGKSVHWFAELAYGDLGEAIKVEVDPEDLVAVERVDAKLRRLGFGGGRFDAEVNGIVEALAGTESGPWELGLTGLGEILGFQAEHPGGQNAPDCLWILSDDLAIVWEVKSEEQPSGAIGARTAQQANGHANWLRGDRPVADEATVLPILVSSRERLGENAERQASDICVLTLEEVRDLAGRAVAALRRLRASGDGEQLRDAVLEELRTAELLPSALIPSLCRRRLDSLPTP